MALVPEETKFVDPRIYYAYKILSVEAPMLLDTTTFITRRLAKAYVWYRVLCEDFQCPDIDPRKPFTEWSDDEIRKIVDKMIDYAVSIISSVVRTGEIVKDKTSSSEAILGV